MRSVNVKDIDSASVYIMELQTIMQQLVSIQRDLELDLLKQYLDEEELSFKQIPRVPK